MIEIGEQLDLRLAKADYPRRVPVNLLKYAALVMHGDRGAALTQLQKLEKLLSSMPDNTETDWIYDGTLRNLRAQQPQSETQQGKDAKLLNRGVIPANLRTLKSARPPSH